MSDGATLFPVEQDDERCPACGLDPCGCGVDLPAFDGDEDAIAAADFDAIEAVAAIVAATPIAGGADIVVGTNVGIVDPGEDLSDWIAAPPASGAPPSSPAIAAFLDRRAEIEAKHGGQAVTDRSRPPALMAQDLKGRACAIVDRLSLRAPNRECAALALNTLATIGALALALHERLTSIAAGEKPALGGDEGGLEADAAGGRAASEAITAGDSAGSLR